MDEKIIYNSTEITNQIKNSLKSIKSSFQPKVLTGDSSTLETLAFQQNVLKKQMQLALKNFDIALASRFANKLEELQNIQLRHKIEQSQKAKQQTQVLQREMAYDVFSKLKDLPSAQTKQILASLPNIETDLGEWFLVLKTWLDK